MTRDELLQSPEYWKLEIQMKLHDIMVEFMEQNNINRKQLSEKFGVTKSYISQILNGEFDHRISKLIELSLKVGKVPIIEFEDIEQVIEDDIYDSLDKTKSERPIIDLKKAVS